MAADGGVRWARLLRSAVISVDRTVARYQINHQRNPSNHAVARPTSHTTARRPRIHPPNRTASPCRATDRSHHSEISDSPAVSRHAPGHTPGYTPGHATDHASPHSIPPHHSVPFPHKLHAQAARHAARKPIDVNRFTPYCYPYSKAQQPCQTSSLLAPTNQHQYKPKDNDATA